MNILYRSQKIKIDKVKDRFKLGVWHYNRIKQDKKLQFTVYRERYITQGEAEEKAKELNDKNLAKDIWIEG